jgi:hypothetical protein
LSGGTQDYLKIHVKKVGLNPKSQEHESGMLQVKVKFTLEQAMKAQRRNRGTVLLFL